MRLQSLKECKKVAWGFKKHGRDFRKLVEGGKERKNTKKSKRSWHDEMPPNMFKSWAASFTECCEHSSKSLWRTGCLMWRPYLFEPFSEVIFLSSFPINTPPLPLTSTDSTKTWERYWEPNLQNTSPCSSTNCPFNIVRGHYAGFLGWGTSVLEDQAFPHTPGFPTPQLAVNKTCWKGAGSAGMHLSMQSPLKVITVCISGFRVTTA